MCKTLKVSKSGYYYWCKRSISKREKENNKLLQQILAIYDQSNDTYGSPRIYEELYRLGYNVSRPRVARIMKKNNIESKVRKKWVVTTDSKHSNPVAPNLLNRNFTVDSPGQVWVSDLTYIKTKEGWLYLTVVIDLFDRKVIGWALSSTMQVIQTSIAALKMALSNRKRSENLIFHSDRGVQYTCSDFTKITTKKNITQSMSRKGNCWDNAVAESFFKTIKTESIYRYDFKSKREARTEVFKYIEIWYNRKRRHSALNYATPLEIGNLFNMKKAA
jgi:transposase InsO family protein